MRTVAPLPRMMTLQAVVRSDAGGRQSGSISLGEQRSWGGISAFCESGWLIHFGRGGKGTFLVRGRALVGGEHGYMIREMSLCSTMLARINNLAWPAGVGGRCLPGVVEFVASGAAFVVRWRLAVSHLSNSSAIRQGALLVLLRQGGSLPAPAGCAQATRHITQQHSSCQRGLFFLGFGALRLSQNVFRRSGKALPHHRSLMCSGAQRFKSLLRCF